MTQKPAFWNSIAIYLLLYNNILLIISLIIALKTVVAGRASFDSAIWYQIATFFIYLLVVVGLISGGKKGYLVALLFIPFIFLEGVYPPMTARFFPLPMMYAFRLIELISMFSILLAPSSRHYLKDIKKEGQS